MRVNIVMRDSDWYMVSAQYMSVVTLMSSGMVRSVNKSLQKWCVCVCMCVSVFRPFPGLYFFKGSCTPVSFLHHQPGLNHQQGSLPSPFTSPLSSSPSQGCFDYELIVGWGTCKQKSKPINFKRTGRTRATGRVQRLTGALGAAGWSGGGFPCSFKGDTKCFRLSLKSSDAKLWKSGWEAMVSKTAIFIFCQQAWAQWNVKLNLEFLGKG